MRKTLLYLLIAAALIFLISCTSDTESNIHISSATAAPSEEAASETAEDESFSKESSEPTASPTASPLTLTEIEENLEALVGEEVEYDSYDSDLDEYRFTSESGYYDVDDVTGELHIYQLLYNSGDVLETLDEDALFDTALGIAKKYCPDFFDYSYELIRSVSSDNTYNYVFRQLSEKSRHTGNSIGVYVKQTGVLSFLYIYDDEDPTAVDQDFAVEETQALEIAYTTAKESLVITDDDGKTAEIYFDDTESQTVTMYLYASDGVQLWSVKVSDIPTSLDNTGYTPTAYFSLKINANTGEVSDFGGGKIYEPSDSE